MSFFPNGLPKIEPVSASTVSWYPKRQSDVIAIDFGTSTLALAYKVNGKVRNLPIQEDCSDLYVPTVLLLKPDGSFEIGERALLQYTRLENIDARRCVFFDRVKLDLQNDQMVSHATTVKGSDDEEYLIIEVIALILQKVRLKLSSYFEKRGSKYVVDDFHWVLTVPALWGEKARDMMREAAYMAGLCSNIPKWNELLTLPLKPSRRRCPFESIKQYESCPERLSLVYEPDAAAAWCNQVSEEDVRDDGATPPVTTDNFFLTIDVGGGTIDVTAHQVLEHGRMKRIKIPHGEVYGGTIVNEEFKKFLGNEIVRDPSFSKYKRGSEKANNTAQLLGLVYITFEKTKIIFAEEYKTEETDFFVVQLPVSFADTYKSPLQKLPRDIDISRGRDVAYKKNTQQLHISRDRMSSFFNQSIKKLYECITRARDAIVREHRDRFEIFYLVGGFGGCKYVADKVREKYCQDGSIKVIIPLDHHLAVVRGACAYYDNQILSTADATYGLSTGMTFNPTNPIHKNGSHIFCNDEGIKKISDLFQPVVQIGQELKNGIVFADEYVPAYESSKCVTFPLYSTKEKYLHYTDDKNEKELLNKLATLTVDLSEGMDLPRTERLVDVLFDFNGIEIKVYARFRYSAKRVSASIDFLSTMSKFDDIPLHLDSRRH